MELSILRLPWLLLYFGSIRAQIPVIMNPGGSAIVNQLQNTDVCVYPLTTSPVAANCVQDSGFAQFALRPHPPTSDFCVYVVASATPLVTPSYIVTFTCDDGGGNTDSSYAKLDVIPNAVPVFGEGPSVLKFVDAAVITTSDTLFTAAATDTNIGDTIVYSLDQTFPEFDINGGNGKIQALMDFDQVVTPSFSFKVRATDNHGAVSEETVSLVLNNFNTPPQITNLPTVLEYPEDTAPGADLYICVHDEPGSVTKSFTVNPIGEKTNFGFTASSCKLRLKNVGDLNFERTPSMTITLTINDGVYSRDFPFTFNVLDVNEPPSFASPSYTMDIEEGPGSTPVVPPAFMVTDPDAGDSYTFTMGTGPYDSYFTVDSTTGALTTVKELDLEAPLTQVTVTVVATDAGGETATTSLTVNIIDANDNDPEFSPGTVLYISPKTPVGAIGNVVATDKDSGNNALLTYSLVSDSSGGKFLVQPDGSVYLNTPVTEAERNDIYSVVARATDAGTSTRSADTTITIVFNPPPVITNIPNLAFISEDMTSKVDIFKIDATDADTFNCVVDSVNPSTTNTAFVVEQKGGVPDYVFYTGLEPLSSITTPTFLVDVVCIDAYGGKSIKSTLTVKVIQNQPPAVECTQTVYGVDAAVTTVGDTVHTVVATDTDVLTYTLSVIPSPGPFTIDTNGNIVCQKKMIRETTNQYIGTVTVADTFNTETCTITLTMTNTNQRPVYSDLPKSVSVDEDLAGGSPITVITITDLHECDPTTFTWDVDLVAEKTKFDVSMTSKVVTVTLAAGQELDHETVEDYVFYFDANDGCLDSQTYPLYLTVTDINEPPEFLNGDTYSLTVDEVGSPAVDLGCNGWDPDVWDSHTLVLEGKHSEKFLLTDPSKCTILPVLELERDKTGVPKNFKLTMKMTDKAGLSSTATINVKVNEVNDNTPECTKPAYFMGDIYNNDNIGRRIGTVQATDDDRTGSVNRDVTFSIVAPSSGTSVVDITSDGRMKLVGDPEAQLAPGTLLDFTVKVTDGGTPSRSTTCKVNIQYIYTTTPPPPPTPLPTMPTATGGSNTNSGSGGSLSSVDQALSNPVVLGLIAALGALALLGTIAGLAFCCRKCGACKGGNNAGGKHGTNRYAKHGDSRGGSEPRQGSPKSNQVGSSPNSKTTTTDIYSISEVKPNAHDGPTTFRYL